MKFLNTFFGIFIICLFTGCISSTFTVKSDPPDSEVFIKKSATEEKQSLGKTPLTLSQAELQEKVKMDSSGGEFYEVIVEKKEFQPEHLMIPIPRVGHSQTIVLAKLKPAHDEVKTAQLLLQYLFNSQKLANQKEYERAQVELDKALAIDSNFSRALSLRGSIYFIQQNYEESLKWFEKALASDPQFEDAIKMITQIKKITGKPLPASEASVGGAVK